MLLCFSFHGVEGEVPKPRFLGLPATEMRLLSAFGEFEVEMKGRYQAARCSAAMLKSAHLRQFHNFPKFCKLDDGS